MNLHTLFPKIETDQDKQLLYKLEANLIYCTHSKTRIKILMQMKMILDRSKYLKSAVFEMFKDEITNKL